jgi:hypothetical protein
MKSRLFYILQLSCKLLLQLYRLETSIGEGPFVAKE